MAPTRPQLAEAIKSYLAHCQNARRLSDHTCSAYKTDLAAFEAIVNTEPPDDQTIATALEKIIENPEHKAGTIARRVVAIHGFLNWWDKSLARAAKPLIENGGLEDFGCPLISQRFAKLGSGSTFPTTNR